MMLEVVPTAAMSDSQVWVGRMPCPQTGATQYHAQLGLPDKVLVSKGYWELAPLDLLNGLALNFYQQSLEVLIVSFNKDDNIH